MKLREVQYLAQTVNCNFGKLPIIYLGLLLGSNPKSKITWRPVIDKLQKKLASWKSKYMSMSGRLTLLKTAFGNIPLYFMSICQVSKGVAKEIERIKRHFL